MKIRNGFVSNSSSSSFIIAKSFLTESQIKEIGNWTVSIEDDYEGGMYFYDEKHYIAGYNVRNHSEEFSNLLKKIGVSENHVYYTEE